MRVLIAFMLLSLLSFASEANVVLPQDDLKARVELALKTADHYIQLLNNKEAIKYVGFAYKYGPEVYGEISPEYAAIQRKMGNTVSGTLKYYMHAAKFRRETIKTYEQLYGNNAVELLPVLKEELGTSYPDQNGDETDTRIQRVKDITQSHFGEISKEMALLHFEFSYGTSAHHSNLKEGRKRYAFSKKHLKLANKIAKKIPEMENEAKAWNLLINSQDFPYNKKYRKSNPFLYKIIEIHKKTPLSDYLLGETYGWLVDTHYLTNQEKSREFAKLATRHGNPMSGPKTQIFAPIERIFPKIPADFRLSRFKTGYVTVEFTVTKEGKVKDPHVIERIGTKSLERVSLQAIKKFKYTPKIIDGKAVEITKVRKRFKFVMQKNENPFLN